MGIGDSNCEMYSKIKFEEFEVGSVGGYLSSNYTLIQNGIKLDVFSDGNLEQKIAEFFFNGNMNFFKNKDSQDLAKQFKSDNYDIFSSVTY